MQNSHDIIICPHPLKARHEIISMPEGLTIAQMIEQGQPDSRLRQHAHVHIDGLYIRPEQWNTIKPSVGSQIEIRVVPTGGGGDKNPLRTILTIAVIAASTWVSGGGLAIGGWLKGGSFTAMMAGTAVGMAGSLLVNAIAPPTEQDMDAADEAPSYKIESARNRARRYAPIRKILGKNRVVPDLAAMPYTENKGDDQYLRMLFCWGYGPLCISDLKIGETPIENYDGIQIEHRLGFPDEDPFTLYPNTVNEEDLSIELVGGAGWTTRTTQQETDVITVDIAFPAGLVKFLDDGSKSTLVRDFEVQYAPAGTTDWSHAGDQWYAIAEETLTVYESRHTRYIQVDVHNSITSNSGIYIDSYIHDTSLGIAKITPRYTSDICTGRVLKGFYVEDIRDISKFKNSTDFEPDTTTCTSPSGTPPSCDVSVASGEIYINYIRFKQKSTSAVRRSIQFDPGERGQYDVQVRRITSNENDDDYIEDSYWTALRSIKNEDPVNRDDVALTAIRIKATGQLNGVIDELNGICESISRAWDDNNGQWVDNVITRNPASHFLEILQGNGIGESALSDDRIDLENIKDFQDHCTVKEFTCDLVIESRSSVKKHLHNVVAAGRASITNIDGKWGAVMDRKQTVYHQHVTPRNSWDFQGQKEFEEIPHAIKVRFRNSQKGYQQDTVIAYDDGYSASNATKYEEIQRKDVTDSDLAWRHGRFHLANVKLRPETFSFKQDVEYIKATRGDMIKFAHTVPMIGLKSCRVKSISTNSANEVESVTVDDVCTMESDKTYFIRFRLSDDTSLYKELQTSAGEQTTLYFETPFDAIGNIPEDGDLAMFGESELEAIDLIIRSIDPIGGDLSAKITCVHAASAIHDADIGTIPDFDSQISEPSFSTPPQPKIEKVRSNEKVLVRDEDGSLRPSIVVDFSISGNFETMVRSFQAEYRESSESSWTQFPRLEPDTRRVRFTDVEEGGKYDIRIRSAIRENEVSSWTYVYEHTVVGKSTPPQDVVGFQVNAARDRIELSWNENTDRDIGKYEIREGSSWNSSTFIACVKGTSHQTRQVSNGPWQIKAIDTAGNYSTNATQVSMSVLLPEVTSLRAQIIDNNALLRWGKEAGSFDIESYEVRKGDTLASAIVEGTVDVTFCSITEIEGGEKIYWIVPVDAADNYGTEKSITVNVDDPPDFVLRNQFQTDWQGNVATQLTPQFSILLPTRLTQRIFSGLSFDGVDDYVAISGYYYDSVFSQVTVSAWIKPNADGIIASYDRNEYWRFEVGGYTAASGYAGMAFMTDSGQVDGFDSSTQVTDGNWHFMSFVYDNGDAYLYVDGVQENSITSGSNIGTGVTRCGFLGVGSETGSFDGTKGPTTYYDGLISDFRLWNVARTQTEIQNNMNRTLIGDETGLVAYYRIQVEATGDPARDETLEDLSGNDNDGTIYGATRVVPGIKAIAPHDNLSRDDLSSSSIGYDSRDEMIAAGYDYRAQPTPSTAQFIEYYDAGAVVPATTIQVTPDLTNIVGTVSTTVTISTRETQSDSWTDHTAGQTQIVAKNFRYIKIILDLSVSSDTDFAVLNELRTVLKVKLRSDSGTVTVSSNPTTVSFNVNFIDINGITATPQGSTALLTVVDFTDVANPDGFDLYLFDNDGNAVTGDVRWNARGI